MRYAITFETADNWESVDTIIVDDPEERLAESIIKEDWKGYKQLLVKVLKCYGWADDAERIIKEGKYFVRNCEDIDYSFTDSFVCDGCGAELYEKDLVDSHCPECKHKIGD